MMFRMSLLVCGLFLCVACGGKKDAEEKSGLEYCQDGCAKADRCPGVPAGFEKECKQACRAALENVKDLGCEPQFERAAKCGAENFSCDGDGSDCESEYTRYAKCLTN
jgi:hypothetical protein